MAMGQGDETAEEMIHFPMIGMVVALLWPGVESGLPFKSLEIVLTRR